MRREIIRSGSQKERTDLPCALVRKVYSRGKRQCIATRRKSSLQWSNSVFFRRNKSSLCSQSCVSLVESKANLEQDPQCFVRHFESQLYHTVLQMNLSSNGSKNDGKHCDDLSLMLKQKCNHILAVNTLTHEFYSFNQYTSMGYYSNGCIVKLCNVGNDIIMMCTSMFLGYSVKFRQRNMVSNFF